MSENDALFHRLERTLPRLKDHQGNVTAYLVPVEDWRRLRAAVTIPLGGGHHLKDTACSCGQWKAKLGESILRGFDRHLLDTQGPAATPGGTDD